MKAATGTKKVIMLCRKCIIFFKGLNNVNKLFIRPKIKREIWMNIGIEVVALEYIDILVLR